MRPSSPCFECPDRVFKCHSVCEKYKSFQDANKSFSTRVRAVRAAEGVINQAHVDNVRKTKRRYGK